ncbi:phospholipase D-like domain-containing protein [Pantoea sp. SS70]|uniref:phospholipase D-like domain-containing protein n=1 Tax=Pantoea sp. SS70 TaxID=3024247 RepID=UPI00245309AD|nr:phospholipase D-like domain-containing protein [Pantoea sp. SS70]WGK56200.1 phospholipase D-like domain-containing protein [Pantoea sp. SS70]
MSGDSCNDYPHSCAVYFDEDKDTSHIATATMNHWVHNGFAQFTAGNRVKAHLGGKEYFAALLEAFTQAQKTIYITGWQVNWDAQLADGVRLVDSLLAAVMAAPSLKVYIMPWKDPYPMETYSAATERVFAALNSHVGRRAFHVLRAGSKSGKFFSHHQKCVIVDERLAFVGGIDLAYGRYDDNYGMQADTAGRKGMNMYNPCVPVMAAGRGYNPMEEYATPHADPRLDRDPNAREQAKKREAVSVTRIIDAVLTRRESQSPGKAKESTYLDAKIQPRMPWQDYQVEIEGPAVYDLIANFVLRWNSYPPHYPKSLLLTQTPELHIPATRPERVGSCHVQVLRSASQEMCRSEQKRPLRGQPPESKTQHDVMDAMKLLIDKADHYIYIENQFFVSAFGVSSVEGSEKLSPVASSINPSASAFVTRRFPDKPAPENQVAEWLANKIKGHIISFNPMPFHVYIMLPVYPEGRLDDPTIVAQIHLTRQSLVFGSHSLINRIRRTLWVKQQLEEMQVPRKEWHRQIPKLEEACGEGYLDIDIEACYEFVTLLNMRDHDELNGQPVTEQIYVHSKLMIVDDRWVLVGSANINDRSLLGDGDSELAVTIADMDHSVHDLDGSGTPEPCRTFARDLRQKAWRKWMGSAAAECEEALDKPALQASWEKIQSIAKKNAIAYETVFNFTPRDIFKLQISRDDEYYEGERPKLNRDVLASSIWPTLAVNKTNQPSDREKMPFSERFWFEYNMNKFSKKNRLNEIDGYFTLLPAEWTSGENNLIPFNMRLIARNDQKTSDLQLSINSTDNKRVIT